MPCLLPLACDAVLRERRLAARGCRKPLAQPSAWLSGSSLQTGLSGVITANTITVTFFLSSSLPSEQEICILQSSEASPIATQSSLFLNTRRTPTSLQKFSNMNKSQDYEVGFKPSPARQHLRDPRKSIN